MTAEDVKISKATLIAWLRNLDEGHRDAYQMEEHNRLADRIAAGELDPEPGARS